MSKPESKDNPASTPDQLIDAGSGAAVELSEQELNGASAGGVVNAKLDGVSTSKGKVANKAADALDGYIRG
jgi:hypothetical protein